MGTPISIFQLRRKRNAIRDVIAAYETKLREARADLAHVLATLRLFETAGEPADFTPYMDLNRLFRRGETTELCLAALQEEGELDTRQLTARVMKAKGLDVCRPSAVSSHCLASRPNPSRYARYGARRLMAQSGGAACVFGGLLRKMTLPIALPLT